MNGFPEQVLHPSGTTMTLQRDRVLLGRPDDDSDAASRELEEALDLGLDEESTGSATSRR